jgi:hypothetical protein
MNNEDFKNIINQLIAPLGYKRRGNYWRLGTEQLEKVCYLQKSNFSNLYYFNYGFKFKNLDYGKVVSHIGSRLSQSQAFDLENTMSDLERTEMLEKIISSELYPISKLDTETDIIQNLHKLTHPNAIPLKVKEYLNLKN